ncbi:hypothetical protein [Fluviicola taffensis]|uniref:Uncharacterized protein n=1 Tax=Fluviicola taffensis (strain DSM 16823 / NCIMB 13979 / RW262) TaxID=755732 RepID=F2IJH4_FLUTR|nr:hypothetical protein [Fluviicola taffensis]AEA42862.1 hypothetical protein Fluta_0861 [Fluviicola taffensis DSM 16823]
MLLDPNAIIRTKNGPLNAKLEFEDRSSLTLNIDGYTLENSIKLNQHWEISEESFDQFGNKFDFDLTQFDEITDFELEFKLPIFTIEQDAVKETSFTFVVNYSELSQEIHFFNESENIDIKEDWQGLEEIFRQLNRIYTPLKKHLRCCFGCLFSGYEKGGNSLFCMIKSKNLYLSKSFQEWYSDFYYGLEYEGVSENYYCDEFEIDKRKKITH